MSRLKEQVPDLATLKRKISEHSKLEIDNFLLATKTAREEIIKNRRYFFVTMSLLVGAFLIASMLPFYLASLMIISLAIATGTYGYLWDKQLRALAKKHNAALVPIISACLGSSAIYTHDDTKGEILNQLLNDSELITAGFDSVKVDDIYTFEKEKVTVRELEITKRVSNGKNTSTVTVFKGLFVNVGLRKPLAGNTYISTEGDKYGFAHKDFMADLFINNKIKETVLEWNEFERDLHVATDNGMEARYILTPAFMIDLHNWWLISPINMRIVFKGQSMYMLLPNSKIKFNTSTTSVDTEELNKYAEIVIEPLWRTLTLVEDIRV